MENMGYLDIVKNYFIRSKRKKYLFFWEKINSKLWIIQNMDRIFV